MKKIIEKRKTPKLWECPIPIKEEEIPVLTKADYEERIKRLWEMPQAKAYRIIMVYGDREHFSNIHYFTGYDPRWEESLLILERGKIPYLLVGNEGIGYAQGISVKVQIKLYQSFGLMGQPNTSSDFLESIFREAGLQEADRIGIIGCKKYAGEKHTLKGLITDVPHYIIETLKLILPEERMENATDLMADCEYGLKHTVSAKEAVMFEAAGTRISRGVLHCLKSLKPGMSELEASAYCEFDGSPRNMHPNINFGDKHVSLGLNSPTGTEILAYGKPLGVGYGLRGSLVHKSGMYIRNREDLPKERKNYIEDFLYPYFENVSDWYEMLKIGMSFGEIYEMVDNRLGLDKFGCTLNPGHLTHTDEWTNSPFEKGSKVKVRSGMAIQCDYTVTWKTPFMSAHIEDGLIIADEDLQKKIQEISPSCFKRIKARKEFIRETLQINLPEEVLPLSDLSCVCFPYMADTGIVLARA